MGYFHDRRRRVRRKQKRLARCRARFSAAIRKLNNRICELRQMEQIVDSGARRPTRSGSLAIVWAVKGAPNV